MPEIIKGFPYFLFCVYKQTVTILSALLSRVGVLTNQMTHEILVLVTQNMPEVVLYTCPAF